MNRFDLQERAPHLTPECWIKKTSGGTDLFGRLWWDKPGFTMRTEFFKPEKGRYLHPVQHRPITHREAARLQSFPDEFRFAGSKIEVAKQIGNAVPPLLAARLADCVHALLLAAEGSEGADVFSGESTRRNNVPDTRDRYQTGTRSQEEAAFDGVSVFRLHCAKLPGKPVMVLPTHKKAIFVHGCFRHGHRECSRSKRPSSNAKFRRTKIDLTMHGTRRCKSFSAHRPGVASPDDLNVRNRKS